MATMAWADVVENEEQAHGAPLPNLSKQLGNDFPSLAEAAKAPPPGKKAAKPKATKMSFSEFVSMPGGGSATFQDKNLQQKAILASLPTSSRGLPREEGGDSRFPGGMGGPGFRDYGARGGAEGGGFSREDRPPREDMGPSRADTIDDWGSTRTFTPSGGAGGGGGSRYGGGAGGGGGGGFGDRADRPPREPYRATAADDTEDWGRDRKFEPSAGGPPRGGAGRPPFGAGGGFPDRDSGAGPRGGGGEEGWGRGRDYKPADDGRPARGFSGSREDSAADKEDRWSRRAAPSSVASPSGADGASAAAGGERPRLKLAPRTAPIEQPSTSAPAAADAGQPAAQPQPKKPSSNPFGAARPREEVLKEKGVDPIKEALKLEHGEVARDETPAERELKEEVEALQKKLAELKASPPAEEGAEEGAQAEAIQQAEGEVDAAEKRLLILQAEEDDKVRFARSAGSGTAGSRGESRDGKDPAAAGGKPRW